MSKNKAECHSCGVEVDLVEEPYAHMLYTWGSRSWNSLYFCRRCYVKIKNMRETDYALENPEAMTDIDTCPFCNTFLYGSRGGKTLMHPYNGCILEGKIFSDDFLPEWERRSEQEARE